MKPSAIAVIAAILLLFAAAVLAADNQPLVAQKMSAMPLAFTKNMGQWDDRVLFRASAGGATMWFTKEGVTYRFTRRIPSPPSPLPEGWSQTGIGHSREGGNPGSVSRTSLSDPGQARMPILPGDRQEKDSVEQLVLTAKFVGANPNPEIIADGQMEYKCNYFLGNDQTKWHTDVPNYEAITLRDIYPGINLKYSGDGTGQAAYEFVTAPGADISQIKVQYEGAEETSIDADGRMVVKTKWGDMTAAIKSPVYAPRPVGEGSGVRAVLSGTASFSQLSERTIGFEADRSARLTTGGASRQALGTLAVGLVYSTYLGGGSGDQGNGIAVDDSGYAYVTGNTWSSDFPTQNPLQTDQGNGDAFVTKLSSSGALIYSTYLGGGENDYGFGIAVDGSGYAYVTGSAGSDFPTLDPYQSTYQGGDEYYGGDVFVTKLSNSGNSLIYSTYLGGSGNDHGDGIAVDSSGYGYVTGWTESSNFPTLNPYQATFQGGLYDVFVTKLSSSGNSLIYSTYLGGENPDAGRGIAVDSSGNAYVTGYTSSTNFPTQNPFQATYQGGDRDVFVTKLSSTGNTLIYSTYLGGESLDYGCAIAVDGNGHAYVTGVTEFPSSNFPTVNPYQATFQGGLYDVFVTKLSSSGNSLIYSTYIGGGGWEEAGDIAVDGSGNASVTGFTTSSNFPTLNPYQTYQGGTDVFVTELSSAGNSLIYSTYLGGGAQEEGWGIAVDGSGNTYVTGWTSSTDFPTLNPLQGTYGGGTYPAGDAFVAKLYADPVNDVSDEITFVSLPEEPALDQNYPNPFNPSTEIGIDLPKPSFVSLDIYDVLGRKVTTLINEHLIAGSKRVQWDGRDNTGAEVASGVYFYRLQIADHVEVKKMVLLK